MANKNVVLMLIIYTIVNISCKSNLTSNSRYYYKIISIDSISNIYIVRAKNQGNYYKIVSKRIDNPLLNCKKIKIDKSYKLDLVSLLKGEKFTTMIGGVDFEGKSILFERDSINDIHIANNLIGLCLMKN